MKTIKITLVSRWFGIELKLRINANCANILQGLENPIDGINNDLDRYCYDLSLAYLSKGQAKKVKNFFGKDDSNYFERVIF